MDCPRLCNNRLSQIAHFVLCFEARKLARHHISTIVLTMGDVAKFSDCCKAIWVGQVTLVVDIAESDATSNEKSQRAFILASRMSYLPCVLHEVIEQFQQYAVEFSSDVWFECHGHPIPRLVRTAFVSCREFLRVTVFPKQQFADWYCV